MTPPPSEIRLRIEYARAVVPRREVVDPFVRALAALADLVTERLAAQDLWERSIGSVETGAAERRLRAADRAVREALGTRSTTVALARPTRWQRLQRWIFGPWGRPW